MLIPFAIILPVFMAFILGGIDVGMAQLWGLQLQFSVEAASWCAATQDADCADPPSTLAYVANITGLPASNFTVNFNALCGRMVTTNYVYVGFVIPNVKYSFLSCYQCGKC